MVSNRTYVRQKQLRYRCGCCSGLDLTLSPLSRSVESYCAGRTPPFSSVVGHSPVPVPTIVIAMDGVSLPRSRNSS